MKNKYTEIIKPTKNWVKEISLEKKLNIIGGAERLTVYVGENLGRISLYKIYDNLNYKTLKRKTVCFSADEAMYINSIRCLSGHGKIIMDFEYSIKEEEKLPENKKIMKELIEKYKSGRFEVDLKPLKLIHFIGKDGNVGEECPIWLNDLTDFEIINLEKKPLEILVQESNSNINEFESNYLRIDNNSNSFDSGGWD